MELAPLEGSGGEVRHAVALRREALARLAQHLGLPPGRILHHPAVARLARERRAAWWLANGAQPAHALLAGAPADELPPAHPRVEIAVVSRTDGPAPRLAHAILRANVPPVIAVHRAAEHPWGGLTDAARAALAEHGVAAPDDAPLPLERAARADIVIQAGDVPAFPDAFRGKRIHLWRTTPEAPATREEARFVYGQVTQEAHCLLDEYRRRLHRGPEPQA